MARPAGLLALAALLILAPLADAQEPDLALALSEGVRCAPSAKDDIGHNLKKATATPEAIGAALNLIAADQSRCAPMRDAATELAANYPPLPVAPTSEDLADAQTRAVVAKTLAEADRQASQLKFDVGPPPRKMTSGRAERP